MNDLNILIYGDRIFLRGQSQEDLEGNWFKWFNDPIATRFTSHGIFPNTLVKQKNFFEEMQHSRSDLACAIVDKKTNKHVGVIGLHSINWISRNAEISLMIDRDYQQKGVGLEAMTLLIDHGFKKMNLHKIYAGQDVGLEKWRKALETIGFIVEGFQKEHIFREGEFRDIVLICVFKDIFYKSEITKDILNKKSP